MLDCFGLSFEPTFSHNSILVHLFVCLSFVLLFHTINTSKKKKKINTVKLSCQWTDMIIQTVVVAFSCLKITNFHCNKIHPPVNNSLIHVIQKSAAKTERMDKYRPPAADWSTTPYLTLLTNRGYYTEWYHDIISETYIVWVWLGVGGMFIDVDFDTVV